MLAFTSNQLLVTLLAGLMMASGAALVVADTPGNDTSPSAVDNGQREGLNDANTDGRPAADDMTQDHGGPACGSDANSQGYRQRSADPGSDRVQRPYDAAGNLPGASDRDMTRSDRDPSQMRLRHQMEELEQELKAHHQRMGQTREHLKALEYALSQVESREAISELQQAMRKQQAQLEELQGAMKELKVKLERLQHQMRPGQQRPGQPDERPCPRQDAEGNGQAHFGELERYLSSTGNLQDMDVAWARVAQYLDLDNLDYKVSEDGTTINIYIVNQNDRWPCYRESPRERPDRPLLRFEVETVPDTGVVEVGVYLNEDHPATGALVYIDDEHRAQTNDEGWARFTDIAEGAHYLYAKWETRDGQVLEGKDEFYMGDKPTPETRTGYVIGKVWGYTDDDEWALAGALVQLRPADNWHDEQARTVTGEDGLFEFEEVPVGEWELRVSKEGYEVVEQLIDITTGENEVHLELAQDVEDQTDPVELSLEVTGYPAYSYYLFKVRYGDEAVEDATVTLDRETMGSTNVYGILFKQGLELEEGEHTATASFTTEDGDTYTATTTFKV